MPDQSQDDRRLKYYTGSEEITERNLVGICCGVRQLRKCALLIGILFDLSALALAACGWNQGTALESCTSIMILRRVRSEIQGFRRETIDEKAFFLAVVRSVLEG